MKLFGYIAILLLIVAVPAYATPPNVCLISIDTERADHLSAYGYPLATSPNFDRLSRQGTLFNRATAQAPWTLPSHVSLLTSKYASVHGVDQASVRIPEEELLLSEILKAKGYQTAAFVSATFLSPLYNYGQGFDLYDNTGIGAGDAEITFKEAEKWLSDHYDKPFFIFLHFMDPHMPYQAPSPYDRLFMGKGEKHIAKFGNTDFISPWAKLPGHEIKYLLSQYDGEIRYADHWLGQWLKRCQELDVFENTIFAIVSDHGEAFGEHHNMGHSWFLYNEVIRVPLLIGWPGRYPKGRLSEDTVQLIDVAPTILNLLGEAVPRQMQGESLAVYLDPNRAGRNDLRAISETVQPKLSLWSLEKGDNKYIFGQDTLTWNMDEESEKLYDLATDPEEQHDIAFQHEDTLELAAEELERTLGLASLRHTGGWHIRCRAGKKAHGFKFLLSTAGWFVSAQVFHPEKDTAPQSQFLTRHVKQNKNNMLKSEDGSNEQIADKTVMRVKSIVYESRLFNEEKVFFLRTDPPNAMVTCRFFIDGKPVKQKVYLGSSEKHPSKSAFQLHADSVEIAPSLTEPPDYATPSITIWYSKEKAEQKRRKEAAKLDEGLKERLRTLGYLD